MTNRYINKFATVNFYTNVLTKIMDTTLEISGVAWGEPWGHGTGRHMKGGGGGAKITNFFN